jgi:Protein of unknown function (DUF1549)/Protein of unknown function (DUF1553)
MSRNRILKSAHLFAGVLILGLLMPAQSTEAANRKAVQRKTAITSQEMSELINTLVKKELSKSGKILSEPVSDVVFQRRIKFDLTGKLPTPNEVTFFGINPDPEKREKLIDDLLASDDYGKNWAKFWWDVIISKATEVRAQLMKRSFEAWMADQMNENHSWDQIATDMITATGDVRENGATAIIFAQSGKSSEIASEVSRVFLGIQIQCANCHDHLTDKWKRKQFHQLASFFPRVNVRPVRDKKPRSFEVIEKKSRANNPFQKIAEIKKNAKKFIKQYDQNNDKKITRNEIKRGPIKRQFNRLLKIADTNSDKALSAKELKNIKEPENARRFLAEHYMPNLDDPSDKGKRMDPVFFLTGQKVKKDLNDQERRAKIAELITSDKNEWFAKAFINRIWYELVGEGFYTPVDDIGPERDAIFPEVIDTLSDHFINSGYDVKWLVESIVLTEVYQQSLGTDETDESSFAAARTGRYRSDQLYDAITQVLGVEQSDETNQPRFRNNTPRGQFNVLFGYDPSLSQDEIKGSVPQALFMMNSPTVNKLLSGNGQTRLSRKLDEFKNNEDLIAELYMMVLSRDPSEKEMKISLEYIKETGNRKEGVEDILWSLLNSSEFLSKK